LPRGAVRRYMTTDGDTVEPQTPLPELARIMIDAHIHHVIVVDGRRRPIGVVSSSDILAALAGAGSRPGRPIVDVPIRVDPPLNPRRPHRG